MHSGANIDAATLSSGLPEPVDGRLAEMVVRPCFLMVGTVEPRKGHLQTLAAFDRLWEVGVDARLIIVGTEGWKALPDHQRRNIPEIVYQLRSHPESGKRLFWLQDVSDAIS